jgi:iron complex transport system substrate-binding protein
VRSGKIFKVPVEPFGWFDAPPGINRLVGVPWLLSLLYSEGSATAIADDIRELYKLFYQVDLTEDQLKGFVASTHAPAQ